MNELRTSPSGTKVMRVDVSYATIGNEPLISPEAVEAALQAGLNLEQVPLPRDLSQVNAAIRSLAPSFVLARASEDPRWLVEGLNVASVNSLPLVLVQSKGTSLERMQNWRKAGVATVLREDPPVKLLVGVIRRLSSFPDWMRFPLGRMDVPTALQYAATVGGEILATVHCPHARTLSDQPWVVEGAGTCSGPGCRGWTGRVGIRAGKIMFAETPGAEGVEALGQMLSLSSGHIQTHEVFIRSNKTNVGKSIQNALLEAAAFVDHEAAGIEQPDEPSRAAAPPPPPKKNAPPPPPNARRDPPKPKIQAEKKKPMGIDSIVAAANGVKGVAICDDNGWVKEVRGTIDGETVCAVVTMSLPQLQKVAGLAGMGALRQWAVGGRRSSVYASLGPSGTVTAVGDATTNLESALRTMAARMSTLDETL